MVASVGRGTQVGIAGGAASDDVVDRSQRVAETAREQTAMAFQDEEVPLVSDSRQINAQVRALYRQSHRLPLLHAIPWTREAPLLGNGERA